MKLKIIISCLALSCLSSCVSYKQTLGTYLLPTENIKTGKKVGKVCDNDHKGSDPLNIEIDMTVETARKRGNITNITSIEKEVKRGFMQTPTTCIIVRGN